jgi:hypothetical protein
MMYPEAQTQHVALLTVVDNVLSGLKDMPFPQP